MEVENKVQLAHVAEVAVQHLDEVVDDVEHDQFVVGLLNARHEVKRRVPVPSTNRNQESTLIKFNSFLVSPYQRGSIKHSRPLCV